MVTVIEAAPHILAPFDTDMTLIAERKLNDHGIGLVLGDGIQSFEKQADGTLVVHLQKGKTLPADFVIVSFGIRPDTDFLTESDIALGNRGHILVNEYLQTNIPNIYAVGDAVMTNDVQAETPWRLP